MTEHTRGQKVIGDDKRIEAARSCSDRGSGHFEAATRLNTDPARGAGGGDQNPKMTGAGGGRAGPATPPAPPLAQTSWPAAESDFWWWIWRRFTRPD